MSNRATRPSRRSWAHPVAAAAGALLLTAAACGGGDGAVASGAANPAKPTTTTTSTTARPRATTSTSAAGPAATAATTSTTLRTGPITIMPLGDSLTQGADPADPSRPQSYRGFLHRRLTDAGYTIDFVGSDTTPTAGGVDNDSEGHGGYTIGPDASRFCTGCPTTNLSDHLAEWFTAPQPEVVLLLVGINDMIPQDTPGANGMVRPVVPSQAASKLRELVQDITELSPGSWILVASYPPVPFLTTGTSATGVAFAALNAEAAAIGDASTADRIVHVAMYQELAPTWGPSDLQADGLHPTAAGADKMAAVWFDALVPVLDSLRTTR